ncbi:hypothetical protein RCO28_29905 [Streptomyces sp. LHD-70]|uniref:hypothetical protein n=1 Tax=Streptomyces sp. LHD-70 TaxID=3072140 RepID=UPI00280F6152|nr:hypothetical protein [Streptomyces sp. LHD-70]MDQ8706657.1 hypothetical protein [Streptomyces sp. LHD-70]
MTASVALRFERISPEGDHRDLRLHIGAHRHTCDSYYLAIDESPTAVQHLGSGLARLLDQWMEQVDELRGTGGIAYLPYDFSDQCTAWLRVSSADGGTADVQAGWSLVEGYGFDPSNYRATAPEITDFEPISNAQIACSLEDLSSCLVANRDALAATGP